MASRTVGIPLLAAVAVTRGMLGAGIGLLVASRLGARRRTIVGRTLLSIGIASTVPLMWRVFRGGNRESVARMMA